MIRKVNNNIVEILKNEITIIIFGFTLTLVIYTIRIIYYAICSFSSITTYQIEGAGVS